MLLQLAGLVFAVVADPYVKRTHRIIMIMIATAVLMLIGQNYMDHLLAIGESLPVTRTLVSITGYTLRPMIMVLFFYIC